MKSKLKHALTQLADAIAGRPTAPSELSEDEAAPGADRKRAKRLSLLAGVATCLLTLVLGWWVVGSYAGLPLNWWQDLLIFLLALWAGDLVADRVLQRSTRHGP